DFVRRAARRRRDRQIPVPVRRPGHGRPRHRRQARLDRAGLAVTVAKTDHSRVAALFDAAREGDRAALDELVSLLTPLLWQVARGRHVARTLPQPAADRGVRAPAGLRRSGRPAGNAEGEYRPDKGTLPRAPARAATRQRRRRLAVTTVEPPGANEPLDELDFR